jgi:periplasmic protein TonB
MNYAQQQRDPTRHLIGITLVVLFHVVLGYALANGLAGKILKVIKDPLDVNLIQEIKPPPPPPPPPKEIVKPKVVQPPPPAYVPPPEVAVDVPRPVTVTTVAVPPPPAPPVVVAPPPPVIVKEEPPAVVNVGVACPNHQEVRSNTEYPAQAQRLNLSGNVMVEFTVDSSGSVKNVNIVKTSNKVFNNAAINAVAKFQCIGQNREVHVRVPFEFRSEG